MMSDEFSNIKYEVENWFRNLQHERKCSSTSLVSKIVNHSSPEVQENVKRLISHNINSTIAECIENKNFSNMLKVCNTINGCFDNFTHAAEAVRYSFPQIVSFILHAIDECQLEYQEKKKIVIDALELLHCLSRILILVLKLRQDEYIECEKENFLKNAFHVSVDVKNEKRELQLVTHKIAFFLKRDDILFDTKNNFSICCLLIREMLDSDEENLKKYQKQLLATIPNIIDTKNSRLLFLQFLISSSIISTWSASIIDEEATFIYLKFFIALCENFSSETPFVLNASRTLFLLIKHECFKNFLLKFDEEDKKVSVIKKSLLSCVFMLLEHPVSCVRHSAKDFLLLLASHSTLQMYVIDSAFKLPKDKRSYFISVAAIAHEMDTRILIEKNKNLAMQILNSVYDSTLASHVSFALENLILNDSLCEKNFDSWCELWIIPLLISLMNVPPIVGAEIDKLFEKIFKKHPNLVLYLMEKLNETSSKEQLRCIITALKISHKQGFKFKIVSNAVKSEVINSTCENKEVRYEINKKETFFVGKKLLEHCLHQGDDEIRISAFSFLVEAQKSTETYLEEDFRLINYFLKYNLNNHQPASRQKILNLVKKMLVRFSDSRAALLRETKLKAADKSKYSLYESFLDSLVEFCFSNIFTGCNFNRLNTVLNILVMCFEIIKDMSFNTDRTDYYWTKLLVALDSSYEENKELTVILAKKLNYSFLSATNLEVSRTLYKKSFSLISHMEPPDVLTGSYLLKILIDFPSSKEVLSKYFLNNCEKDNKDIKYQCIKILAKRLKAEVQLANLELITAALCGPMYGTLSAIRLIFKDVNFSHFINEKPNDEEKSLLKKWGKVLNDVVQLCLDMIPSVACIVNNSSPEGHFPMDFQNDLKKMKIDICREDSDQKQREIQILFAVCDNFMEKYKLLESSLEISEFDAYETLRSFKCLLKESNLLINKLKGTENEDLIPEIKAIKNKIKSTIEELSKSKKVIDWPVTAQVLLLCAWRSIKEVALFFGDLINKLPVEVAVELNILKETTLNSIGEELKILLCEIKHRGSFEHVYVGFTQFIKALCKCSWPHLNTKPRQWLEEISTHLELPANCQKLKLCSTRRSAGLPFLIQAVICSEITSVKSSTPSSLHRIMQLLLDILAKKVTDNSDSKIHALNILRALFKHAQLGEHVSSYISKALIAAIRGSRAPTWSERNSSNLLFSSLMIRIFGVARSKDEILKKNKMTSRTFFQRYSDLYEFLLTEIKLAYSDGNSDHPYPKPSLYLILLILGRLYPTPREDAEILDLSEFLPHINFSRRNPVMKIRELGARALVPLLPADRIKNELNDRFMALERNNNFSSNEIHGLLLQIRALLKEWIEILENSVGKTLGPNKVQWIENTKWIILDDEKNDKKKTLGIVISVYLQILHDLFKHFQEMKEEIGEIVLNCSTFENLLSLTFEKKKTNLGIHLCLENFFYLKLDVWAERCLQTKDLSGNYDLESLVNFLLFMLKSDVDEVCFIPLRTLCCIFNQENEIKSEEEDFSKIKDNLMIFRNSESMQELQVKIVNSADLFEALIIPLNTNNKKLFKSKITLRLWLRAFSEILISKKNIGKRSDDRLLEFSLMKSMEVFVKSKDKEISSCAFLIYSVYFLRQHIDYYEKVKVEKFSLLIRDFMHPEADTKEKLAVAKILNHCFDDMMDKNLICVLNLWMVPMKLLLDECVAVRLVASNFVYKLQTHLMQKFQKADWIVPMETFNWPACDLVPLKTQECLLDFYINISDPENYVNLIFDMLMMGLSSFFDLKRKDDITNDEFGVFEKVNPNPFYEEVAVSNMIADKLIEWKTIINIQNILEKTPNELCLFFIYESFECFNKKPINLLEILQGMGVFDEETKNTEFSILQLQKRNIANALGLNFKR